MRPPSLRETCAGCVSGRAPFALSRREFLIGLLVVLRENPAGFRHQTVVAIHGVFDQGDARRVHSIEEHATGRQTRCRMTLFRGGLIDRQRLVRTFEGLDQLRALEQFVGSGSLDGGQPIERGSSIEILHAMLMPGFAVPRDPSIIEPAGEFLELRTEDFLTCRASGRRRHPYRLFEAGKTLAQRRMRVLGLCIAGKELIQHVGRGHACVPRQHLRVRAGGLGGCLMADLNRRPVRVIRESRA